MSKERRFRSANIKRSDAVLAALKVNDLFIFCELYRLVKDEGLGVEDAADRLGIHKQTCYTIIRSLEDALNSQCVNQSTNPILIKDDFKSDDISKTKTATFYDNLAAILND